MKWTLYLSILSKSIKILMHNKCIMHGAGISYITGRLCMHRCIAQQVTYETSYCRKGRKRWHYGLKLNLFKLFIFSNFYHIFLMLNVTIFLICHLWFWYLVKYVFLYYIYKMLLTMVVIFTICTWRRMHIHHSCDNMGLAKGDTPTSCVGLSFPVAMFL